MWWIRNTKDASVIQRVLNGHRDDFGVLVERYLPMVQAIARAQGGETAALDDIAQEAFLRAFVSLDQLREYAKFPAWLAAIARNSAIRLGSHEASSQATARAWAAAQPETVASAHVEAELRDALRREIELLEPAAKEALYLHYFAGQNSREIARTLEISEPAVRKRLQRARETLGGRLLDNAAFAEEAQARSRQTKKIVAAVLLSTPAWQSAGAASFATAATCGTGIALAWGAGATKVIVAVVLAGVVAGGYFFLQSRGSEAPARQHLANEPVTTENQTAQATAAPSPQTEAVAEILTAASPASSAEGIVFEGQVVDGAGTPVTGALARGACWGDDSKDRQEAPVDEQGMFRLSLPEPCETYLVWAEKEGYARLKQDSYDISRKGQTGAIVTIYREAIVEGQLVDLRGAAVAGRVVTARNHSVEDILWTESATTDPQGRFKISKLVPGEYGFAAVEESAWSDDIELQRVACQEGELLSGLRLVLDGGLSIEGHVTDEAGNPLKGAMIQAHVGAWNPRNAYTDEKGYFLLDQLSEGEASLHVWKDGHQGQGRTVTAGATDVDFVLVPLGTVTGRVIDATTKQPIQRFEVCSVEGETAAVPAHLERSFKNFEGDKGEFKLDKVNPRSTIIGRAPGYRPAFLVVDLEADGGGKDIVLVLETGLSLSGRVTDEQGTAVSGAFVLPGSTPYFPEGMDPKFIAQQTAEVASATSGEDGSFTLNDLSPGKLTYGAWHPDKGKGSASIELGADGSQADFLITISLGHTLSGVVSVGGEPRASVPVMATSAGGLGMPSAQATTDAQGAFVLTGVPSGKSTVTAMLTQPGSPFGGRRLQRDVEVASGKSEKVLLDFPAATGAIVGKVVAPGMEDIAGNVQCMVSADGNIEQSMSVVRDGSFDFKELSPGAATLMVSISPQVESDLPPGAFNARARALTVEVKASETTEVEVSFIGNAVLEGRVLGLRPGEQGRIMVLEGEVAIEEVSLESMVTLAPLTRGVTMVTPEGGYQMEGLEAGRYTLQAIATASNGPDFAEKARFATAVITIAEGETATVDFDLQ